MGEYSKGDVWTPTKRDRLVARAYGILQTALNRGLIPPLEGQKCLDCGEPATCYEHRNYYHPLAVDAVCKRCNLKRGPGFPHPSEMDGGYNKLLPDQKEVSGTKWSGVDGGEGFIPNELPLHVDIDWKEIEAEVDESTDRLFNATNWRKLLRAARPLQGRGGVVGSARDDFFKAKSPWAI